MRHRYLREALSSRLEDAPCSRIDRKLGPELAEGLDDIARIARTALPYIQKAAPGVLQGAATGFLAGGPMGAVVGGAAGGLSSLGVGSAAPATPGAASATPTPGATANPAVANPAALNLLLTVLRPEVVDALIAMALGTQGARQVPIAGTNVPVAGYTNLIQSLAEQASAAHHAVARDTGVPRYLGEAVARGHDISRSYVRAEALRALVHEAWAEDDALRGEDIDEEAEARDLEDIYLLGGLDS